jgi:large subunit ribosomal protein L21
MYAILQQSGHQYRVSPGDRLVVDRLTAEVGSMVALEPVVLLVGDDGASVGTPVVEGARVAAMVVSHRKGAKLRVFKYKAKKHYKRTHGHRSFLTELRVEAVLAKGEPMPKATKAEKADKAEKPVAAKPARTRAKAAAKVEEPVAEETLPVAEAPAVPEAVSEPEATATEPEVEATATEAEAPAPKKATTRARKPKTEPSDENPES